MNNLYSTGQVARALGVTEPKVAELVRRGRITPAPNILAGRRLWTLPQALRAAELLCLDSDSVAEALSDANQESQGGGCSG